MLREVRVVVGVALDVFLDVDVRVRRLVLLVKVVVAEVAEEADPESDRVLPAAGGRARHDGGGNEPDGDEDRGQRRNAAPRGLEKSVHAVLTPPLVCVDDAFRDSTAPR